MKRVHMCIIGLVLALLVAMFFFRRREMFVDNSTIPNFQTTVDNSTSPNFQMDSTPSAPTKRMRMTKTTKARTKVAPTMSIISRPGVYKCDLQDGQEGFVCTLVT